MRTAELHGRMVLDADGREPGRVKDFRLVQGRAGAAAYAGGALTERRAGLLTPS